MNFAAGETFVLVVLAVEPVDTSVACGVYFVRLNKRDVLNGFFGLSKLGQYAAKHPMTLRNVGDLCRVSSFSDRLAKFLMEGSSTACHSFFLSNACGQTWTAIVAVKD